ncbi:uncharacterized protein LOC116108971 [Pistacia vera]|uniref:uncharacterized protein LOC116108971 n=1 Tax=Pistacia vera TaxID=55513 RepID=UPI001263DF32|nr:uncharacterized protein LOC116108971 [Pistacia vera]
MANSDPTQNSSSHYYLHPNENPAVVLVTPVLNGTNYHSWACAMKMALLSKNKLKFVDGTLRAPLTTDPMFLAWEGCNTMVICWLNHSLAPSITSTMLWIDKTYEVWEDLRKRFSQGDIFRISDLQEEIYTFKQEDRNVTNYFTELKILWDELLNLRPIPCCSCTNLCSCGALTKIKTYQSNDYVIRFLKGLGDQFAIVRSQIMLMEPFPSINKVFSLVVQQERQMVSGASKVFVSKTTREEVQSSSKQRIKKSNQSQHNGDNRFCTFCGKLRHTIETCYKKHGYPSGYKPRNQNYTAHNVISGEDTERPDESYQNTATPEGILEPGDSFTQEQYQ